MDAPTCSSLFHLAPSTPAATNSLATLYSMQQEQQLCDIVLETECGNQIAAHRVVLAASSPYFRAMFVNNLAERFQRNVYIKEIDFDILRAVVVYAYNREVSLPSERVLLLLIASDLLQIQLLFQKCCKFLESNIRPENCLSLRVFANMHNCTQLHRLCTQFSSDHFEEVIQCSEYLSLPFDQLKDLISRDELRVSDEEHVYAAVLQWIYHDLDSRRGYFAEIMSLVRLPFMSSNFLVKNVEQEQLVKSEGQCQEFIEEAYLYKTSPEKRSTLKHSPRARPRKPFGLQDVILTVGGMGKTQPIAAIEQYNICTDSWITLTEMEFSRYGLSACFHNGCLYALGGYCDTLCYVNTVDCYCLKEERWKNVAPMQHSRRYHNVEVLYGLIYVAGGQNTEGVLSSVEYYDPTRDMWTFVQPMITPRMYHGLVEMDRLLFAIGGHSGRSRLNLVEFYDPSENKWTTAHPMNNPRSVAGVATLGSSIFVAGGYSGKEYLNSVEYYDNELDKWFKCTPMTMRRSALGLVAYAGCLYACGGFNGSFECSVEMYDPTTKKWNPCVGMQIEKVHFGITTT